MTTRVFLVHGAWQSTACWIDVLSALADPGMQGEAITLTGLGHDTGQLNRQVGLSNHVEDVVRLIDSAPGPCVLVGHSYGGMVVTGACEQRADRVAGIVYVDGFVPDNGQSALQLLPQAIAQAFQSMANEQGDGWRLPAGDFLLDVWGTRAPGHREKVRRDLCDFSIRCFEEVLCLPFGHARNKARGYIAGGLKHEYPARAAFARFVDDARAGGWLLLQADAGHTCEVEKPDEVAKAISGFVDRAGGAA